MTKKTLTFRDREFKGSRFRCLLATSQEPKDVVAFLAALVESHATVEPNAKWAPRGFRGPDEAKLGETVGVLSETDRQTITNWWLAVPGRANTPNWDLVSQCTIGGKSSLILVEAKAHEGELDDDRCGARNKANCDQIKGAIAEANGAWNQLSPGFALSADSYYQLSNRFAFAWKLAELGTPVILVYLGFLNAEEMMGRKILRSLDQWRKCVEAKTCSHVPRDVWDKTFDVNGTPLTVLIRAANVAVAHSVLVQGEPDSGVSNSSDLPMPRA